MAARIPVIEQSTFAGGAGPSYLQPLQQSDAIGRGLSNLGSGLNDAARGQQELDNALAQRAKVQENKDAAVWAGKTLSDAQLQWQETLQQSKSQAAPGAPDFTPTIIKNFDDWAADALKKAPNDTSRRFLGEHLNSLRTSLGSNALQFEAQSRTDDRVNTRMTSMDTASQAIMGAPTKENFLSVYGQQKAINDALEEQPEVRRKLNDALQQKMVTGYWLGRIRQDPAGAAQELQQGLTPSFVEQSKFGTGTAPASTAPASVESLWPALISQESGGNQAAVSPKGAIGAAQIMPGTAPEAAKLAGLPYDADRLATDRAYNEALGQAYLNKQLQTFGGDQAKALAAYNMGPGSAEKGNGVIGLVQKYGDDWLAHAPAETQNYVKSIMGRVGGGRPVLLADASGSIPDMTPQPSGNSVLDATPMNIRLQMMQHADTEMSRAQAIWRSQVSTMEGDQIAAYMNGQPVAQPLTQEAYVRAYGPLEGLQRFENYKSIAAVGGDISAMKLATPEQLAATVVRYAPDSSKPGYEAAVKRYQLVATAADQVNQARQADPIAYAQQTKIGNAQPLDFSDSEKFAAELRNRVGLAETMQAKYGTGYQLLSKAEATTLQQGFQGMTSQQKLGYLTTINRSITDPKAYRALMQQIAPDSPVTAVAGNILSKQNPLRIEHTFSADEFMQQQDVAARILEGEALINPNKATKAEDGKGKLYPMPKEQDMRDQFNGVVGKAFAGDPVAADAAFQAVKAYYAGQGAKDGDVSGVLDSGRLKASINAIVGVSDINGNGEVIRPWGMPESRFKDQLQYAFNKQMQATGLQGTPQDNFGAYGLQMVQDSKYLLRNGTGYLVDKTGNPIVLDLSVKPSHAWAIPGGETVPVQAPPVPVSKVVQPKTPKMATAKPSTK